MTPNAQHKRAERERRKAAGYKRVELWLPKADADTLRDMAVDADVSVSEVVRQLVHYYHS